jgi:uncharacterized protein
MPDTKDLLAFVRPYYEGKDIMHDLSHIERILICAEKLVRMGNYQVDMTVLTYAAYFHGIIYISEQKLRTWLMQQELSTDMQHRIITAAWESQTDQVAVTLEGRVLHDAHMLEGGKTFMIVKALITGSLKGQSLQQTIDYIETNADKKGTCYLPESSSLRQQQHQFAQEFMRDLKAGLSN